MASARDTSRVGYIDVDLAVYRQHSTNMSREYFEAMVPDIEQRTRAIDAFVGDGAARRPDGERLEAREGYGGSSNQPLQHRLQQRCF